MRGEEEGPPLSAKAAYSRSTPQLYSMVNPGEAFSCVRGRSDWSQVHLEVASVPLWLQTEGHMEKRQDYNT